MAHPPVSFGFDDIPNQTGRTVRVAGASSGLGAIVTEQLAARGATVLMAVRDVVTSGPLGFRIAREASCHVWAARFPGGPASQL